MVDMTYREFIREVLINDIEIIVTFEDKQEKYYITGLIDNKYLALVQVDDIEILMLSKINLENKVDLEEIKNNIENCVGVELYIPRWLKNEEKSLFCQ